MPPNQPSKKPGLPCARATRATDAPCTNVSSTIPASPQCCAAAAGPHPTTHSYFQRSGAPLKGVRQARRYQIVPRPGETFFSIAKQVGPERFNLWIVTGSLYFWAMLERLLESAVGQPELLL